jgi:hypothetical protein
LCQHLGKIQKVARRRPARHAGSRRRAQSGQPVLGVDVIRHPAHLAVADDIDARLRLVGHGLFDCSCCPRFEPGSIERLASVLFAQQVDQIVRPGQAAYVGGENAIAAQLHRGRLSGRPRDRGLPGAARSSSSFAACRRNISMRIRADRTRRLRHFEPIRIAPSGHEPAVTIKLG